jgi:hypothetical protein
MVSKYFDLIWDMKEYQTTTKQLTFHAKDYYEVVAEVEHFNNRNNEHSIETEIVEMGEEYVMDFFIEYWDSDEEEDEEEEEEEDED